MAASDTDRKQKSKAVFIAAPGIESSITSKTTRKWREGRLYQHKLTGAEKIFRKKTMATTCDEEELLKTAAKVVDVTDSNATDTEKLALLLLPAT